MEIFNYYLVAELSKYYKITVFTNCKKYSNKKVSIDYENPRLFIIKKLGLGKFAVILQDILKFIRNRDIKIVVLSYTSNSEYLGFYIPVLKKIFGFEYIIINHGGGIRPWKHIKLTKRFFCDAKYNIAVSEHIKEEYEKRTGREVLLIPPLVPFKKATKEEVWDLRKKLNLSEKQKVLFSVGTLKKLKNPMVLLKAFISLGREYAQRNDLILIFIGDGPLYDEMNRMVESSDLKERIKLVGNIPNEEVKGFFGLGDIFILNSRFEGKPLALLEALYNNSYIIGSDSPGISSLIDDKVNGVLYEYNNQEQLMDKIRSYVSIMKKQGKIFQKKESVYELEYKEMTDQYKKIINNMCG